MKTVKILGLLALLRDLTSRSGFLLVDFLEVVGDISSETPGFFARAEFQCLVDDGIEE